MNKDSFLDTNVIVNFINYQKGKSDEITTKCYLHIRNKTGKFIICYAVMRELSNIMTKLSIIHKEVLHKVEDESYSLKESKALSKKDVPFAEKLYVAYKNEPIDKIGQIFSSERDLFEIEIERFLKNNIDLRVIPLEQIKSELVNAIRDIIDNYADCQIVASALQHQNEQDEIFLFVTADKKDLSPNGYEYLKEYGTLKNYKFPELCNLAVSG
ncbi:MAG: hypothetical protein UR15_C0001G0034 [Parcubacteria group bacterium GW2011_GWA2_31_28]|nr:MAG: hypothetical protein UR15_C0001G0034 [Parcubacteria group bacterium GW2011_GWA2_31_28]